MELYFRFRTTQISYFKRNMCALGALGAFIYSIILAASFLPTIKI